MCALACQVQLELDSVDEGVDRSQVESYFVAFSASFLVGWGWVIVFRDLAALSGDVSLPGPEDDAVARSFLFMFGVVILGPMAVTLAVLIAKRCSHSPFLRQADRSSKGDVCKDEEEEDDAHSLLRSLTRSHFSKEFSAHQRTIT
jgi:hypothetical protein